MDPALLRRAYDRDADRYDERFLAQQQGKFEVLARLVPAPEEGVVLDLGGGTGLLREALLDAAPAWGRCPFVVADLSRGMLRHAARRGALPLQADARRLPLKRASVARVLCVTGLVVAGHVGAALVSAARVCAPGGLVAFSLLPGEIPEEIEGEAARVGLDALHEGACAGDRLFVWRRRAVGFHAV